MKRLTIQATENTPAVNFQFDKHRLRITGECWPDDPRSFWEPVLISLREYLGTIEKATVMVDVGLNFLNTGSFKALAQFYHNLDQAAAKGNSVVFRWNFRKDDEMARGYGEDLEAFVPAQVLRIRFQEERIAP